jgi:hypothetical protein
MIDRLLRIFLSSLVLLVVGAALINISVKYGLGVSLGWWGWMFWAGIGLILAGVKED